jgi:topoisomerase-4 subunit A
MKGHVEDTSKVEFKQGDGLKRKIFAQTTDQLVLFASNGRFYTLPANTLPGGRGHGEPVRLMVDLEENHDFVECFVHEPARRLIVASTGGYGFIVPETEVIASTRKGKQILNVAEPEEARIVVPIPAGADHVATIGDNRKLLAFTLAELNEMVRGKGVILQRFKDGGLASVRAFERAKGLTWVDAAGRTFTLDDRELTEWIGNRASAGKLAPKGFPRSNSFGPAF